MNLNLKNPIVFFDLETTGVNINTDRIVEICYLKVYPNGNEESKTMRINPEMHIPESSSAIHGIYDKDVVDEVLDMDEETAYAAARELGKKAGLLVGMSSGGNFAAAKVIAKKLGKGKKVVTVLPDTGERYLSTILFAEE